MAPIRTSRTTGASRHSTWLVAEPARARKLLALADVDGWTAAHYLFLQPFGDDRMGRILLEAGPNLDARELEGRSVRDWARLQVLEQLLEVGSSADESEGRPRDR